MKSKLERYIQIEQALLDQFSQVMQHGSVGQEIGRAVISEGAAAIASGMFESSSAGRLGRKVTTEILDQQQNNRVFFERSKLKSQHESLVQEAKNLLSSVSIYRKDIREPNSNSLIERLDRAQEFQRVETRIRRTIMALKGIARKQLVYNKDIASSQITTETVVPPSHTFSGVLKLKELLRSVQGYAKIIDPYVDETTLELLLQIPENRPTKLLTELLGGKEKEKQFLKAYQRFKTERPQFQIRKCEHGLIHDRFILTPTQGWTSGSSLKDIGKKMSIITEINAQSKTEVDKWFDEIWKSSKDLLP
ncbi:MAG TPA: hypothetical protein VK487_00715 [Candidatus Bathyarchaeia archaeon]|nr:hypothetical protein [Candidatus Bathyarchaeia archaeon]